MDEEKMQKAQKYSEELRNNEKKYTVGKTWKMSFDYMNHFNIREFHPFMREMLRQVRNNADGVRLSHYDASSLM